MPADSTSNNLEERLRAALTGRFEIERELLGGGMSRVFVAREIALDRRIVLKVLPPDVAAEVNRDRFRQEVQFAARLQHPHIVPLLSAGEESGLLFYSMPFIEGASLKADIASGRRFTEDEVVEILIDIADALAYAHAEGIVHRDIKPANILRSGAHAVVTDFGVAKALTAALRTKTGGLGITTSGVAIGTPAYMAPEQIAGDPLADHRVDIYAIGLLAYELLSGRAPFSGPSPQAMLAAHLTARAEPLGKLRPDLSTTMLALVERCLEKDAGRRPGSASAVLEILRTIAFTTGARRLGPTALRRRWTGIAVGIVVVAMAAVAWLSIQSARNSAAAADARMFAALDSAHRSDSILRAAERANVNDSAGRLAAQRAEQKRLQRIADSFASVQQKAFDSAMKAMQRANPPVQTPPPLSAMLPGSRPSDAAIVGTPEMFQARALNMGPPRRVFVELGSSMVRSPDVMLRGGVLRDSIIRRLAASGRYRPIPVDSAQLALARGRNFDSLGVWLNLDLFVTVRTSLGKADSVTWQLDVRDQSAITAYQSRSAVARSGSVAEGMVFDVPKLVDQAVRQLAEVDRAPRRPVTK
jgi:serine/threonine-protein kinase